MFCNKCGTEIQPGNAFCSKCGTPVSATEPAKEVSHRVCSKCGTDIQPGNAFCSKCGTPVSAVLPGTPVVHPNPSAISSTAVAANPSWVNIVGCILIIVGAFLPWVSRGNYLGVSLSEGAVILMAGVLSLAGLTLIPRNAQSKRGIFVIILGVLTLVLVFQSIDNIRHNIGIGLWISMVGGLLIIIGGISEYNAGKRSRTS